MNLLATNHLEFSQLISFIEMCMHLSIVTFLLSIMSSYVHGHSYHYIWEFDVLYSIEDVITQPGILGNSFSALILKLFLFTSYTFCIKQETKHGCFWSIFKNRTFICYKTENVYKLDVADDNTSSSDSITTTHFSKSALFFLFEVSDFFKVTYMQDFRSYL